jgi:L-rhamnose isomerase
MYASTAAIKSAVEKLGRFPGNRENRLLIQAKSDLMIAHNLMEARWKIWNSIFWNRSNAATKYSVNAQLKGLTFDAQTSLITAGKLLNLYVDRYGISDSNKYLWCEIIRCLHSANRWMLRDYYHDSQCKQLKLPLLI